MTRTTWMLAASALVTWNSTSAVVAQTPGTPEIIQVAAQSSATGSVLAPNVGSGEAEWIWYPAAEGTQMPAGVYYFRKAFDVNGPESAQVQIACDDRYDLLVNGRYVGTGTQWQVMQTYDILPFLRQGRNVIAVRAQNLTAGSAGLVARVTVKNRGGTEISHSTGSSWRTLNREVPGWHRPTLNDSGWARAHSFGELGVTNPWGDKVLTADGSPVRRFLHSSEFRVERVIAPQQVGSLVALAFNEWGHIIAAREGGPLVVAADTDQDGLPDTVRPCCDKVTNCHGILALNGELFVVGNGPEGAGLYRLSDTDRDGQYETVAPLLRFERGIGEHGAHAPVLGPDGALYLVIGNHAVPQQLAQRGNVYQHSYEGDLVQPRYEDTSSGEGFKAPGGMVLRVDLATGEPTAFVGGLRNSYDICFNRRGELFTHDSDMEWDEGLPWYRATRLLHLVPGGEYGWRSGWAKFPDYYPDNLPPVIETGRGSPTGIVLYDHHMYPTRYHDCLFTCDWSQGRILALRLQPQGASYKAETEVFLQGRPLNVTDIAVGPDGWIYFSTGGRGTEGGVYRVVYTGKSPTPPRLTGIAQAIRQPQLEAAWSRQQLAVLRQQLGDNWGKQLVGIASNPANRAEDRMRALDLMQLLGPFPDEATLLRLSSDDQAVVRAKAACLMGLHPSDPVGERLTQLLADRDPLVRRQACEALVRSELPFGHQALLPLLADEDRYTAWAARLALEQLPAEDWYEEVLTTTNPRVFLLGSLALLRQEPHRETASAVVTRAGQFMSAYMTDDDFVDLLRIVQLALLQGELTAADVPSLVAQLAEEYPANEWRMNRELVRLLAYLQAPGVLDRMLDELHAVSDETEKLHVVMHMHHLRDGWTAERKLEVLRYFERARGLDGGNSLARFVELAARDFFALFTPEEQMVVLAQGAKWPSAALSVLANLPEDPGDDICDQLIDLDQQLRAMSGTTVDNLRTGIVAILGQSGDDRGLAYLRLLYEHEPERRAELAMGMSAHPGGDNWPLLVRALPVLEGIMAQEVLMQLATVPQRPSDAEALRQVVLCGLRLGNEGGQHAIALLNHWTGQPQAPTDQPASQALIAWQEWFRQQHPDLPPAELPTESASARYGLQELLDFLQSEGGRAGDPVNGARVFEQAQCAKCHRFGGRGEGVGPDLSTVAQRFQKKEILESVLFPSQVISDQYASKTIITTDGLTLSGIVSAAGEDRVVVLQSNGEKVTLPRDRIEEIAPNSKSTMPEGLFNQLTLEEIADLFAYLTGSRR